MFLLHYCVTLFGILGVTASLLGLGWGVSKVLKLNFIPSESPFAWFWMGWCILVFLLQILHLFFPMTIFIGVPIFGIGFLLFFIFIVLNKKNYSINKILKIYLPLLIVFLLFISYRALYEPSVSDIDLYHFMTIRWQNEYAIVPGLGNLHDRLAYNQSFFLFVSTLNLYPLFDHGNNLANGLLIFVLIAECLYTLVKICCEKKTVPGQFITMIPAFLIFPIIYALLDSSLSSPSPDIASIILQIILFIIFAREIFTKKQNGICDGRTFLILFLSAISITVKLSNWAFCGSIILILLIRNIKYFRKIPHFLKFYTLPFLSIIIWSLRSFILSGCVAYPSAIGCFNVDWAIPIENVRKSAGWIYSWARWPNKYYLDVLGSWDWVPHWIKINASENIFTVDYPLVISCFFLLASILILCFTKKKSSISPTTYIILTPPVAGLIAWFFTAPDVRFARGLFLIFPIAFAYLLITIIENKLTIKHYTRLLYGLFILLSINICIQLFIKPYYIIVERVPTFKNRPLYEMTEKVTNTGLTVWVPVNDDRCGDSELVCTAYFDENLALRGEDLQSGFMIMDD